ncbi:hypothetical protein DRO33_06680 [Candidatus Bathyarchaeota archaeon]|nr:MAG: hypothetical protein DRO33_06680 [Candidatus Bathyarchaeota archaeon]
MGKKKALVLDASAFIAGLDPFYLEGEAFTVPGVRAEVSPSHMGSLRLKLAEESGKLTVVRPGPGALEEAKKASERLGDVIKLSEVDIELLALAVELKGRGYETMIITDDYAIQNVARELGIAFSPVATSGIKKGLTWVIYCPACRRRYHPELGLRECPVCGTPLKRKPLKKDVGHGE